MNVQQGFTTQRFCECISVFTTPLRKNTSLVIIVLVQHHFIGFSHMTFQGVAEHMQFISNQPQ